MLSPLKILVIGLSVTLGLASIASDSSAQFEFDERFILTRFKIDGSIDKSFSTDGLLFTDFPETTNVRAEAMTQTAEGFVVAGWAEVDTEIHIALVCYHPDGRRNLAFGQKGRLLRPVSKYGITQIHDVAYDGTDNSIVVAGDIMTANGFRFFLARFSLPSGKPVLTFGTTAQGITVTGFGSHQAHARGIAIDSRGKIVVAGYADGQEWSFFAVARYNPDGSLDNKFGANPEMNGRVLTSFPPASVARAMDVAVGEKDRIVAVGLSRRLLPSDGTEASSMGFAVAQYLPDGQLDTNFCQQGRKVLYFGAGSSSIANAVAVRGREIIVAGTKRADQSSSIAVTRFISGDDTTKGKVDKSFGTKGKKTISYKGSFVSGEDVAVLGNGETFVSGTLGAKTLTNPNPEYSFVIASLNQDGSLDDSFGSQGSVIRSIDCTNWIEASGLVCEDQHGSKRLWLAGTGDVVDRLETVLVVPELKIQYPLHLHSSTPESNASMPPNPVSHEIIKACRGFNERVWDAFDGQVRLDGFNVRDLTAWANCWGSDSDFNPIVADCRLVSGTSDIKPFEAPSTVHDPWPGRPDKPEPFDVVWGYELGDFSEMTHLEMTVSNNPSWRLFEAWCTAYTGVAPEYGGYAVGSVTADSSACVDLKNGFDDGDCCAMSSPGNSEFCRAGNHDHDTLQELFRGMACYEWIDKVLKIWEFKVPPVDIKGPIDPPQPWFIFSSQELLPEAFLLRLGEKDKKCTYNSGRILITPSDKIVTIGLSMNDWHNNKKGVGHAKGKIIVETTQGDPVDKVRLRYAHTWRGDGFSHTHEIEVDPKAGTFETASEGELISHDSSTDTTIVDVAIEGLNDIFDWYYWDDIVLTAEATGVESVEWFYYRNIHYGGWTADVCGQSVCVDVTIEDDGKTYTIPRMYLTRSFHWEMPWFNLW